MASITIREIDETTNALNSDVTDIVYVPGFGNWDASVKAFNPTLYTSLDQFIGDMGSDPVEFTVDYLYTDHWDASAFDSNSPKMFEVGDPDPGYIYASELLSAGIPVYFEKVNPCETKKLTSATFVQHGSANEYDLTVTGIKNTDGIKKASVDLGPSIVINSVVPIRTVVGSTITNIIRIVTPQPLTTLTFSNVNIIYTTGKVDVSAGDMYTALCGNSSTESILNKLKDRGTYAIKYLTTGGYPTFECNDVVEGVSTKFLTDKLLEVAAAVEVTDSGLTDDDSSGRGDCIALIDHTNYSARPLVGNASVFSAVNTKLAGKGYSLSFAAMFTPWCKYSLRSVVDPVACALPASFAYLKSLAASLRYYDNWFAIAGVARGSVSDIQDILTDELLTNNIANKYQAPVSGSSSNAISINAITRVNPYGNVIWGNRTLQIKDPTKGVTALGFLNLRNLVCDVRKILYTAARRWMYEQNSEILWVNFKGMITPLLDSMCNGQGLKSYSVTRDMNKSTKTAVYAKVTLNPVYAVESFDITVTLTDEEVSVTEE